VLLDQVGAASFLAALSAVTIVVASLLAMAQDNLKLRLAYSTVGHLSYIVLATSLLSSRAWLGGLYHITAHAVMKITLFFCAGAIYVKTHRENISELDGIGTQMPLTLGAFTVAALGLAGIPPIVGFISKWYLAQGTLENGQGIYLAVLLLSGLLNASYFFPIVHRAFFRKAPHFHRFDEASPLMVVPLILTAALALFLGLFPDSVFHFFRLAAAVAASVMEG
jgi:multicomponent Na+:H+ antiporter subunit D